MSFLLLWAISVHVLAGITVDVQNQTLRETLLEIERSSDYRFFFNESLPGLDESINVRLIDADIDTVMELLLAGTNLESRRGEGNVIALVVAQQQQPEPVQQVAAAVEQIAQRTPIGGRIVDEFGDPVIGATVVERDNPAIGTITDIDGNFSLNITPGAVLQVSFIGFRAQEVATVGRTSVDVILLEDHQLLDELIVVGYTVRRRESLVGALTTVSSEQLRTTTSPSIENLLVSQVAGLHVSPGSGQPGSRGAVILRGQSSLHGNTHPLWVVDGVIVGHEAPESLNPADIESVNVLKDASSTAIYGSQGANGVIVVTTRTPRVGQITMNFSARTGLSYANRGNFHPMTGAELFDLYSSFANQEAINFPLWSPELRNRNFDWWDYATQAGVTQQYNLSISGGTDQLRSTLSIGMHDETGAVRGFHWRRYNFQHRTIYRPTSWLTIRPTITGARREINNQQHSVGAMFVNFPWDSPYDADGNLVPHRPGSDVWVGGNRTNYLLDVNLNSNTSTLHDFSGNFDFDIRFTNWLTFVSTNSLRWSNLSQHIITDPRTNAGEATSGRIDERRTEVQRRLTTQMLRANWFLNDVHEINGLVAYEFSDFRNRHIRSIGTGFLPGFQVLDVTTTPESVVGSRTEWAMQSVFTNWHYTFDRRYFLEFSIRADEASNFGAENRWGTFATVGGGWNIHREEFFIVDAFDELRLRASYGAVGSRPTALYPSFSLYAVDGAAQYEDSPGALIVQIGNRMMTWETLLNTNVGLDMAMFSNRVRLSLDYYIRDNRNLLFPVPVPGVVGVTQVWQNVGDMRNTGIDASLGVDIIRNRDLHWAFNFNIGFNRNRITRLPGVRDEHGNVPDMIVWSGLNIAGSGNRIWREGLDANTWWIPLWAGVNPETGTPQWYRADERGNNTGEIVTAIGQAGQGIAGTMSPDFFGGFSTNLMWRQFDMGAVFGYSVGGQIVNYSRLEYDSDGAYTDRNQMRMRPGWNRWQQPGDIATHPQPRQGGNNSAHMMSSRWLEDGSFLKLRSLSLGYNFALPQAHLSNIRLFFTGENLFTLTNYSGVDPELPPADGAVTGVTGPTVHPNVRRFMFGVNLTF